MREHVERYTMDKRALEGFYSVPCSLSCLDRQLAFADDWLGRLEALEFDGLDQRGKVDYLLLRNHLEAERESLGFRRRRAGEIRERMAFAADIAELEEARRAVRHLDPEATARRLASVGEGAGKLRKSIVPRSAGDGTKTESDVKLTPVEAQRYSKALEQLTKTLEAWFKHYADYKPDFRWWLEKPYADASKQMGRLKKALKLITDSAKDGLIGDPIGEEALRSAIAREMLAYGPEDLVRLGDQELAWCAAEMLRASHELGFGDDWRAALEHVKGLHVALGAQDDLVADLAREAIDFVTGRDLVTVDDLCRELWYVDMISEEGQKTLPFAGYGFNKVLVSYPTPTMALDDKAMCVRANNIHFTRAVVHHELIPGHHLQIYMGNRHSPYRQVFSTPFLGEGWCLHWEMLLWDLGFPRNPEDRVGMLFWRMHRCARIVVSLRFHLGTMSPGEMVDYLVDNVGHERNAATSEVRRSIGGDYVPLYQCAYMIGALQMRALHRELVGAGCMANREFHDAVLREGAIPVELIRAQLTGQELTRDYQASWRFA